MKLDIRSDKVLYIELVDWTICIDDSTNEQIINKWKTKNLDYSFSAVWEREDHDL